MDMEKEITIGTWNETTSRDITHCPSYYAADFETLRTTPGAYELRLMFVGGYTVPMPYWLLCRIDATRIAGALYSGFGGNNFASRALPKDETVPYRLQTYSYELRKLVEDGRVTLRPGFDWLLAEKPWDAPGAPQDWAAVSALAPAN